MKRKNIYILPVALLFSILPSSLVFAEVSDEPKKLEEFFAMFGNISQYLFPIAALVSFVFIVVGGYMWIVAAGDPARIKQAQGTLTWAIIGLVLTLMSIAIVEVIKNFLGV